MSYFYSMAKRKRKAKRRLLAPSTRNIPNMLKFVVDEMLLDVAKYLRIIGYDTICPVPGTQDRFILEDIKKRVLITADKEFCRLTRKKGRRCIYVDVQSSLNKKLSHVIGKLHLVPRYKHSRCPKCNGTLRREKSENVDVDEGIRRRHRYVYVCEVCGHIYWKGSQWQRMIARIWRIRKKLGLIKPRRK